MADSILRLKVDSQEYDNKLKRAAEGLQRYADGCRKAGGTLEHLDDGVLEYTRSLGKMETVSNSARGKIGEMTKAFTDLSVEYKQLTDQEKASPFGKALSESLDQLKVRVQSAKQDLDEINKSLNGESSKVGSGLFSGSKLDGMLQVFGGNLMTKGAGMLANFASEMGDMVKQGIELARQGEGIRIAFERLNQPGLLNNLREATHGTVTDLELMKAAVKFNDFKLPVEELGTMLAFAQQKAKDTGQSVDYMVDSIVTGLGRESLMILDNLGLSASEVKERMKETGDMTKAVGDIIREQMAKAGDYIETAADRATKANVDLQNAMTRLGETFQPLSDAGTSLWSDLKIGALDLLNNAVRPLIDALTEAGRIRSQYAQQGGDSRVNRQLERLRGISTMQYRRNTYNAQLSNYDSKIGSYEQYLSDYKKWQGDKTAVGAYDRMQAFQKQTGLSMYSDVKEQLEVFKKMRAEYVIGANQIINENPAPSPTSPTTTTTTKTGKTGKTQAEIEAEFNAKVFAQFDKAMLKSANAGVKAVDSGPSEAWKAYTDSIKQNADEAANSLESLTNAFEALNKAEGVSSTKKIGKDAEESAKSFSNAASAISSVGRALSMIEDPAAKAAGMVLEAVATVAMTFASSLKGTVTVWDWIAAAAAGTATMVSTIATIKSATAGRYAEGGEVKGATFSGDQIPAMLNAGEIVLNRAQAGNIASQLTGNSGGASFQPYVTGEYIFLGANNHTRATGQGEIVTTGMLRNLGLIH